MNNEQQPKGHESNERIGAELEAQAKERLNEIAKSAENTVETDSSDKRAEAARELIHEHTEVQQPEPAPVAEAEPPKRGPIARHLNHHLNYASTMESLQRKLRPASRTFSKVIHAPAVEKVSETLEKTVARPSATAGATWTAFIVGLIFYLTARIYGFSLSGSEILLSFFAGAILGLVLEGFWRTLKHR